MTIIKTKENDFSEGVDAANVAKNIALFYGEASKLNMQVFLSKKALSFLNKPSRKLIKARMKIPSK